MRRGAPAAAPLVLVAVALAAFAACAEIGTSPDEPASIELDPFPWPSVVIGDTLRDAAGQVAPVRAVVRNVRGDAIAGFPVVYLYADFQRDTALEVDPATGIVVALKATTSGEGRIAARAGAALQVLRAIGVTTRPDSLEPSTSGPQPLFTTTLPDTGRTGANRNSTPALNVVVRHLQPAPAPAAGVRGWLVRFSLVAPANPTNDSTLAAFLVNDNGRPSVVDTTDGSGTAGRRVRIRAGQFPVSPAVDTVVVHAEASYRGVPLRGSPVRIAVPVERGPIAQ
jgi:hypothetical protein